MAPMFERLFARLKPLRYAFLGALVPTVLLAATTPLPIVMTISRLPAAAGDCGALATISLPDTTISSAKVTAAGPFTAPGGRAGRGGADVPAMCQVHGVLKPTPTSNIQFEVWLPAAEWNGKLQVVGNGGPPGTISYPPLAAAVRDGFSAASTRTGHTSSEAASWLEDKERLIDYSYRGLHLTTVNAKKIVQAFYTEPAKRAYYAGCSTGGKQGLMEAQRYPADFDGILAGDAANFWTHQMASETWNGVVTSAPDAQLSNEKLQMIENAAVKACDMLDGAADGLVSDPMHCKFDPASLLCPKGTADGPGCLTTPQVAALKKLYGGITDQRGRKLYP